MQVFIRFDGFFHLIGGGFGGILLVEAEHG
jgi:hypothetical protein